MLGIFPQGGMVQAVWTPCSGPLNPNLYQVDVISDSVMVLIGSFKCVPTPCLPGAAGCVLECLKTADCK